MTRATRGFTCINPHTPKVGIGTEQVASHSQHLARTRALTPFTRALADGQTSAYADLSSRIADFQVTALDPCRRQVTSTVATAGARACSRAAAFGTDAMLRTLHPMIRWDGSVLALHTTHDSTQALAGRPLVLRPAAFAAGITVDPLPGMVTVVDPATDAAIVKDHRLGAPSPALTALLGATRAAALSAIARSPGSTTGQLAIALGLSAAAASRHATVLREAGLISTFRNGSSIHHSLTRLGDGLAGGSQFAVGKD